MATSKQHTPGFDEAQKHFTAPFDVPARVVQGMVDARRRWIDGHVPIGLHQEPVCLAEARPLESGRCGRLSVRCQSAQDVTRHREGAPEVATIRVQISRVSASGSL